MTLQISAISPSGKEISKEITLGNLNYDKSSKEVRYRRDTQDKLILYELLY